MFENLHNVLKQVETDAGADAKARAQAALAKVQQDTEQFAQKLIEHAVLDPEPIFAILRRVSPIVHVHSKNLFLVTLFDDVQEVLARDDVFAVTYEPKMRVITGGENFFLGMQNGPEYSRDTSHMQLAFSRQDLPRLIAFVDRTATEIVNDSGGKMDVVRQLTRAVPSLVAADYFGFNPLPIDEMAAAFTAMFRYLFTDIKNEPAVEQAARAGSAKGAAMLEAAIAEHKGKDREDVIGRCLKLQSIGMSAISDLDIRNNLMGLLIGLIPTTSKCCAQALDQLLKRPEALAGAQAAAGAGDDALLGKYVFEALRFNPNNPGVFRICAEDYLLAKGTLRETLIPKGASVVPLTHSAMFDARKVDDPDSFRLDRPGWVYMHYGYGLHTCFGQYLNAVQIPGILKPLLKKQNLRRVPGGAGELAYDIPFPTSLGIEYTN